MKTIDELGISPAPWRANEHAGVCDRNAEIISGQYGPYNWSNARLIAAAPDLYEAVAAVVSWYERNKPMPYEENGIQMIIDYAKKAIAKASGEETK